MSAAADPVAAKSAFLCMYMRTHPDTLVAFAKHFGRIEANVSRAEMTAIDSGVCLPSETLCAMAEWHAWFLGVLCECRCRE